jgi:hypothetical protein
METKSLILTSLMVGALAFAAATWGPIPTPALAQTAPDHDSHEDADHSEQEKDRHADEGHESLQGE